MSAWKSYNGKLIWFASNSATLIYTVPSLSPSTAARVSNELSDDGTDLLGLLGDKYVQAILAATSQKPMSAKELSKELDADVSTIYRRVDDMLEYDLLVEHTRIVEDGSHHSVYDTNVNHVDIDIDDGEIIVDIEVRESPAERFTRLWDDIRET